MIRWEQDEDGSWRGFSGELLVAIVGRDEKAADQWLWTIVAVKRPKGWRKGSGHRATWLDARRAADEYWQRWLTEAALRPDVERAARQSLPAEERGTGRTTRKLARRPAKGPASSKRA
jgi:hypothetical protein